MTLDRGGRLPRVDEVPANLALMVLGKALARVYEAEDARPLPDSLARILREIELREKQGARGHRP
jgi:hypothetical protein